VAAADVAYSKKSNWAYGVVAVFEFPSMELVEKKEARSRVKFPYISGLLTFREGPGVIEAFKKLKHEPDIILFDGQGLAHPCGMGIATHLGILLDKPTIGCAKSRLIGEYMLPPNKKGAYTFLLHHGAVIGVVLRTRVNVKPIFVSVGFKTNLDDAIKVVLECCTKYRIPEPIRQVHMMAEGLKKKGK
jgi:deoxyribonuclease V